MSAEWEFLITLNEQHRPLRDPLEIQEVALRLIGEHLHASRVNFAYIDGDDFAISRAYASTKLTRTWEKSVTGLPYRIRFCACVIAS